MPVSLFACMATRQVSWRHSSSFAQGVYLDLGKRCNNFLGTARSCGLPWGARGGQAAIQIGSTRAKISCLIARPQDVIQISNQDPLSWHCSVGTQEQRGAQKELGKPYNHYAFLTLLDLRCQETLGLCHTLQGLNLGERNLGGARGYNNYTFDAYILVREHTINLDSLFWRCS